jgi:hypothetical protein
LNVSEQIAEQTSGETGSLGAGSAGSNPPDAALESAAASIPQPMPTSADVESPRLVPEQGVAGGSAGIDAPKPEAAKLDALKADGSKADAPKADAPRTDALGAPGKLMIMSAGDRAWESDGASPEVQAEPSSGLFGKRRLAALAAVVALAAVAGALGGALATAGVGHFLGEDAAALGNRALEETVARIDADIVALKASVEHTAKTGTTQFSKASDRLDKLERAQAEPAAKLAKLSEAVDKLRATPSVASAPAVTAAAAKEVTGSISPPASAALAAAPKPEVARLPTVEGWVLRDVANGGALIEGRRGIFEVYAGDPIPGIGRVDAIRRQDGRWVVVTSKGLIVAR